MDESGQIPYWGGENPPGRTVFDLVTRLRVWLGSGYILMNSHAASLSKDNFRTVVGLVEQALERDMPGADIQVSLSPQPKGHAIEFELVPDAKKGNDDHIWKILNLRIKYHVSHSADLLIDSGELDSQGEVTSMENPGDVHIDICDTHNPPTKVRAGQKFIFRRSGMDKVWREHCPDVEDGTPVVVTQLHSAPKPGTMGQAHISDARTGEFLGMCSMQSLSTQTDELVRSGQVKMVRHNPPLEILSARTEKKPGGGATMYLHYRITTPMDSTKDVEKILKTLYPGWKAISHASIKAGTYPNVKHAYGVTLVKTPELIRRTASGQIDPRNDDEETMRMIEDDRVVRGNPPTDISGTHPGDPIRAGFWVPDKEREKVVSGDRAVYGFLTLHHAGTVLKLLIDVTTDTIMGDRHTRVTGKRISVRLHQPEGIDQVGLVVAQFGAVIANDGNVVKTSAGFSRNPPGRVAGTEIYKDIVEIKAIKRDGKRYVHKFGLGSHIIGLPDGSILIESRKGKRLWKNFKAGG